MPSELPNTPHATWPRTRRRVLTSAAALATPLWLAGCQKQGPLRVGFMGPLTGRMSDLGVAGRNGTQLAIEDLNARGGVGGRALTLMALDDEHKPEVALQCIQRFVEAGVEWVVGPMASAVAGVAAPEATRRQLVMISPTVSAREFIGQADALFVLSPPASSSGERHAEFLFGRGLRTLSVIADYQNKAYSHDWALGLHQRFVALGGRVLLDTHYVSVQGTDYGALAQALLAHRPDVIVLVVGTSDAALLAQQVRKHELTVTLSATAWAAHEQLLQMGGRAVEGMVVAHLFDRDHPDPVYQDFARRFNTRFGEQVAFRSVNAYNAVLLGVAAHTLRARGEPLLHAMRRVRTLKGLQGEITLDAFGDARVPLTMTEIKGGRFAAVESR